MLIKVLVNLFCVFLGVYFLFEARRDKSKNYSKIWCVLDAVIGIATMATGFSVWFC